MHDIGREVGTLRVLAALAEAVQRHAAVAEADMRAGGRHWWKIHEASIRCVGSFQDNIHHAPGGFKLSDYLNHVRDLMHAASVERPYLLGRCMWLLARFSRVTELYTPPMMEEVLTTIEMSLGADRPLNLRVQAVQACLEVVVGLQQAQAPAVRRQQVAQRLHAWLAGIIAVVPLGGASVLSLSLETVQEMAAFDREFTATAHTKIIPLTIAVFLKHHDDPYLLEHVQAILRCLCQNRYCLRPLQEKMLPTLISILNLQVGGWSRAVLVLEEWFYVLV